MQDFSADLLRGTVTSIMNTLMLFVLAKPKYSKHFTAFIILFVFLADLFTSIYFYSTNNLTALAKFDILLFFGTMIFLKPFVQDRIFPWIFNCITTMNICFIVVFISYHLCDFFPYPFYSNTFIRIMLYSIIIGLFYRYVSPFYQQVMENWKIYLLLVIIIFLNFAYYILSADDIEQMLTYQFTPMLLLIFLCILVYLSIFYFQQKLIANYILRMEKQHFQELAYLDPLTGVQNRLGYESYLSNIQRMSCENFCIGIYDINDLKAANDSLGHETGDMLIADASRIICKAFKSSAVFRIGGDEFVSVSINSSENEVEAQYNEMLCLVKQRNSMNPHPIDLSIAFGYSLQSSPFSIEKLFSEADRNMYKNKNSMKNAQVKG